MSLPLEGRDINTVRYYETEIFDSSLTVSGDLNPVESELLQLGDNSLDSLTELIKAA